MKKSDHKPVRPIETERITQRVDTQVLRRCIDGHRPAQQQLYEQYAPAFLNMAYRVVWNREDARDIMQDSFLKIFSSLSTLRDLEKFEGWAKRIVVNNAITFLRKKGTMPLYDLEDMDLPDVQTENTDEEVQHYNITLAKKALAQLAPGYRTIISLYLLEGYDHKEIADILNISVSTSITQFNRGKKRLREMVQWELQNSGQQNTF